MIARILIVGALLSAPAHAAVRALFVGIDTYANAGPGLENLGGAVADMQRIKAVLAARYGLALDTPGTACRSDNPVSVTLTDTCAKRQDILDALDARIAASAPGDTVLFYFSGHGSTSADRTGTQATGRSGTLVPHDARSRGIADIRDTHLDMIIEAATAKGVNMLTIFDSCHSGTATRDLRRVRARSAVADSTPTAPPTIKPFTPAAIPGYRVHLAAAADSETASEVETTGKWEGAFTRALVEAIAGSATPTYADVIAEVRRTIAGTSQNPQAEGALATPFLGVRTPPLRRFDAERLPSGELRFAGGSIAGVTAGSTYGVFRTVADAVAPQPQPVATGAVASVDAGGATLRLATPLPPGDKWQVRELVHAYGRDRLRLRIDGDATLAGALDGLDLVAVTTDDPRLVLRGVTGGVALFAVDGTPIGSVLDPAARDFTPRLRETLRRVANADALVALRGDRGAAMGSIAVRRACAEASECPDLATASGETLIPAGEAIIVEVSNTTSDKTLYPYLFYVDADYGVLTLMPPPGANDPPLRPLETRAARRIRTGGTGRDQIVLVMADAPVDLASLEQEAVRDVLPPARSDLERLLRAARSGQASRDIPRVGSWGATALPLRRVPAKEAH